MRGMLSGHAFIFYCAMIREVFMKLKEGLLKREVMGKTVVVPTGDAGEKIHGVIKLNSTAAFIWELAAAGMEEADIVVEFAKEYELPKEKAETDVRMIIEKMNETGVIETPEVGEGK